MMDKNVAKIQSEHLDSSQICSALSTGWPTLPSAALVLRVYSAASTPTQPIPPL